MMKLFKSIFGRELDSFNTKNTTKKSQVNLSIEPLEERQMLSITPLTSVDVEVPQDGNVVLNFNVATENTGFTSVGITVTSTSGLDPSVITLEYESAGEYYSVPQSHYLYSLDGSKESFVLLSLPTGDYRISFTGDNNTYGSCTVTAGLPGLPSKFEGAGEGAVSELDVLKAQTAAAQTSGNWNATTIQYYAMLGQAMGYSKANYDPAKSCYASYFDINNDGIITLTEAESVAANAKLGNVKLTLEASEKVDINPNLRFPFANADNSTSVMAFEGTVSNNARKLEVQLEFPNGTKTGFKDITSYISNGQFNISEEQFREIFGITGDFENGDYKLHFRATANDERGSITETSFPFTYVKHSVPVGKNATGTVYATNEDGRKAFDINDLVQSPVSGLSYALESIIYNGTTYSVTHGTWITLGDKGAIRYTGGTLGTDGTYYGGTIEFRPTAEQVALSKNAADILLDFDFVIKDSSGLANNKSAPKTVTLTIVATNKTPVIDLSKITKTGFENGQSPYTIDITTIASDANKDDTLTYGTVTVQVNSGTAITLTAGGVAHTTQAGTKITLSANSKTLTIDPSGSNVTAGATETITISLTAKDNANVVNPTNGDQKSESDPKNLTFTIKNPEDVKTPEITMPALEFTAEEAQEGNIATGWTVKQRGTGTLTYKIGLSNAATLTVLTLGGKTTVTGLGEFTLASNGTLTWTTVDESLYRDITENKVFYVKYEVTDSVGGTTTEIAEITITPTPVATFVFKDQDIYMASNSPVYLGGYHFTGSPLQVTVPNPATDTVDFEISSITAPDETALDSSWYNKFQFHVVSGSQGEEYYYIRIAEADLLTLLDEYEEGKFTFTVSATLRGTGETIVAKVYLHLEEGVKAILTPVEASIIIAEKATVEEETIVQVSGLDMGVSWDFASWEFTSYTITDPETEHTLTDDDIHTLLLAFAVDPDPDTGELKFVFTPNQATREVVQFLREGQKLELVVTYQIWENRYGLLTTGTIKLTVNGQNDQPELSNVSGIVAADETYEITIADLVAAGKLKDVDIADTHTFHAVYGIKYGETKPDWVVFDTAFLEGTVAQRTIILEKGSTVLVAQDALTLFYTPNQGTDSEFYTLREGDEALDSFEFKVRDDSSNHLQNSVSDKADVIITVVGTNKPPVAENKVGPLEMTEGDPALVILASEIIDDEDEIEIVNLYGTDPNIGDSLTFYAIKAGNVIAINGVEQSVGEGMVTVNSGNDQTLTLESGAVITLKSDGTIEFTAGKVKNETVKTESFQYQVIDDAPTTPLSSVNWGTINVDVTGIPHVPELIDPDKSEKIVSIDETDFSNTFNVLDLWISYDEENMSALFNVAFNTNPTFDVVGDDASESIKTLVESLIADNKAGVFDIDAAGNITFNFPAGVYQKLGVGQSVIFTLTYNVISESGAESTQTGTLIVTINGVNDPPERLNDPIEMDTDANVSISFNADEILADTNWSDPDFNDNPMKEYYTVSISESDIDAFNARGTGTITFDSGLGTWAFDPGSDFNYLAEGETATVYIEYTITDQHNPNKSAIGTIALTVTGIFSELVAENQAFVFSTETTEGADIFVGSIAYSAGVAQRYDFEIVAGTVKAWDSSDTEVALPDLDFSVDAHGNILIDTSTSPDWTDIAYFTFDVIITNTQDPTDTKTIEVTVNVDALGEPLALADLDDGGFVGENFFADLNDQVSGGIAEEFGSLRLIAAELGGMAVSTELFNRLSMLQYAELASDGNLNVSFGEKWFNFIPAGSVLTLELDYIAINENGLETLGKITLVIEGIAIPPEATYFAPKTTVNADSTAGMMVSIDDLVNGSKPSVIAPNTDVDDLSFAKLGGQVIDAAFLAGDRTIVLPSGARLIVASDGKSFIYYPNITASSANPYYTLKHNAILSDHFAYSVVDDLTDETSNESTITIGVKGVNKQPVAKPNTSVATNKKEVFENGFITFWPQDLFTDTNIADNLQFNSVTVGGVSLVPGGAAGYTTEGIKVTWNLNGSITFDARTLDGKVAGGLSITGQFTCTVTDNSSAANEESAPLTHSVNVKGINDPPVANNFTAPVKQIPESGTTTVNVKFEDLFTDPDMLPTPDTHVIWMKGPDGKFAAVTSTGIRFDSLACTVKLNADGKSLDFVFDIAVDNDYDRLREGVVSTIPLFEFYVVDNHGARSKNNGSISVQVKGVNKTPVVIAGKLTQEVAADKTLTLKAGDLVTDRNVNDTHEFATIDGAPLPAVGTVVPIPGYGTVTIVSKSELRFTPAVSLADIDTPVVLPPVTFTIRDNSGAANAETAAATMTITIVPASKGPEQIETDLQGFIANPTAVTALKFDDFFKNYETIDFVSVKSGTTSKILANYDTVIAALNSKTFEPGDTILLEFIDQYHQTLDLSPIRLVFDVANDIETKRFEIEISVAEQFTTVVHVVPVKAGPDQRGTTDIISKAKWTEGFPSVPETFVVTVGETYYLQFWVQDDVSHLLEQTLSKGLGAVDFVMAFDQNIAGIDSSETRNLYWYRLSDLVPPTVTGGEYAVALGMLSDGENIGVHPNGWLVIQIEVTASAAGDPNFQVGLDTLKLDVGKFPLAGSDSALVHLSQIEVVMPEITHKAAGGSGTLTALAAQEKEVDGGIYMRTVTKPTTVGTDGTVSALPQDANMLHEWQTHYVELWVKASEVDVYTKALADLQYNSNYFTATNVELGQYFNIGGKWSIDDSIGLVSGIGGGVSQAVHKDGYILLGRVKFESIGTDNVPWSESLKPHSLGLELVNGSVRSIDGRSVSELGRGSKTELWANPFDTTDSGVVNASDFIRFAMAYGQKSTADSVLVSQFDFTKTGSVNSSDFILFAMNYGVSRDKVRDGNATLKLPENITQRYIGMKLEADNIVMVGTLLDAANKAWADALGLDKPIDVQLVVRDFGNSSTLAEAMILEVDANGIPTKGIITLDNDAAGFGWYSQLTDPVDAGRYDLYTTLLHELGHIYGVNTAYNAFNAVKFQYGSVIDATGHVTIPEDVMYVGLNPGERKFLSTLDVNIIETAYGAARGDAKLHGFEKVPSKMQALNIDDSVTVSAVSPITGIVDETIDSAAVAVELNAGEVSGMPGVTINNAKLNVPVYIESGVPRILQNEENARSLAELELLGLSVALPKIVPNVSQTQVADLAFAGFSQDDEFDFVALEHDPVDIQLSDELLKALI